MRTSLDVLLLLSCRLGITDVNLGPHWSISVKVWSLISISTTHLPGLVRHASVLELLGGRATSSSLALCTSRASATVFSRGEASQELARVTTVADSIYDASTF